MFCKDTVATGVRLGYLGQSGKIVPLYARHCQGPTTSFSLNLTWNEGYSVLATFLPPERKEENAFGVSQGMKMTVIGHCSFPSEPQLLHSAHRESGARNQQHEKVRYLYLVSTFLVFILDFSLISFVPGWLRPGLDL